MTKKQQQRKLVLTVKASDCEWQEFRSGGPGGQNQNKRSTGVRVIHPPSGARGESREHRTQLQNKKAAWRRMVESAAFKVWLNRKLIEGPSAEERVEEDMQPHNLKVEVKQNGKWIEETS